MRSLLFVPGDSPKKLDKAMTSGADALIVDLEDSISPERKAQARDTALAFLNQAGASKTRPRLLVRINGLQTGLTDADLDVIVAGRPDAIMFPKAEGGAAVIHADAKITAREAIHGLPAGSIAMVAIATETAKALSRRTYAGSSLRLTGLTWGAEDLSVGSARDQSRQRRKFSRSLPARAQLCLAAQRPHKCKPSTPSMWISAMMPAYAANAKATAMDSLARWRSTPQVPIINEVFTPPRTRSPKPSL